MNSFYYVLEKLRSTNNFDPDENSADYKELQACAVGFDILFDALEELERECFVKTAESFGLDNWEKIYSSTRTELPIESRREMINSRLLIDCNDNTLESAKKTLRAAGIDGDIIENPASDSIFVNIRDIFDTMVSTAEAVNSAAKFMPAHLLVAFDYNGQSWDFIDSKNLTWEEFEEKELSFAELDAMPT